MLKDLRKSIILGLSMSIISLIILMYQSIYSVLNNLFIVGTMIYFICLLITIKSDKNIIKFANFILIITFIIRVISSFKYIKIDFMMLENGIGGLLFECIDIIELIYWIITTIFLLILFSGKLEKINNFIKKAFVFTSIMIIFCYAIACILAFNYINPFGGYIYYLCMLLFSISIIPYFCKYQNIIEDTYDYNENNILSKLEIVGFVVLIFVIIIFIWREVIYSPKNNIENKIESLFKVSENLDADYTIVSLKKIKLKIAKTLEIKNDVPTDEMMLIYKDGVLGSIMITYGDNVKHNEIMNGRWSVNERTYNYFEMKFKQFTYNNIDYEYAYMGDTLLIYGFLKNNKSICISMDEGCYARLSLEELAGILNIDY